MAVDVKWLDDSKTAILREFEGSWTWNEFYASQKEAAAMLNSVKYEVPQIFDFSQAAVIPANALSHIRDSDNNMPENRGASIVVTQSRFYGQMYSILEKVIPRLTRKVVLVKSLEEALERLHEITTDADEEQDAAH